MNSREWERMADHGGWRRLVKRDEHIKRCGHRKEPAGKTKGCNSINNS